MSTETLPIAEGRSGLSWPGIIGGAVVASAVTLIITLFGAGLGLSAVSPLSRSTNPSGMTFTVLAAIWLLITQWVASFFGGYLAGRLRPSYRGIHAHEVTFRDTASGFVSWALATLVFAALIGTGAGSLLSEAAKGAFAGSGSMMHGANSDMIQPKSVQTLLRSVHPDAATSRPDADQQARGILMEDTVTPDDHDYLVNLVMARTGLTQDDATHRVDTALSAEKKIMSDTKVAADNSRKASASLALYTAFSMLVGAFIACVAGAIGGKQRDAIEADVVASVRL